MFPSGYPVSSPSSFTDISYLQRAASEGRDTLPSTLEAPTAARTLYGSQSHSTLSHRNGRNRSRSFGSTNDSIAEANSEEEEEGFDGDAEASSSDDLPRLLLSTTTTTTTKAPLLPHPTEATPLLPTLPSSPTLDVVGPTAASQEFKILLGYTLPICSTHFLEYSLLLVNVVSLGHLGTIELAASSLASITSNVVALSIIQGLCTALDTLCPQAWTSNPKDMSLYAMRTLVILVVLLIPQFVIFWNAESLLLLLRQDPQVASHAALYLKVLSFGLPGYAGFEVIRRWLQSQGLMTAPVIVLVITAPLNVFLNWLLVWSPYCGMGFIGAPLASAITMNTMFGVSLIYAVYFAPRDGWGGFTWAIFRDLEQNFQLGLAGTAMVASEWWSWEIVGLSSAILGPESLAAQSILLTSASLFYQVQYALSIAGAVRVGNLLGAQRPKLARITSRVCLAIAVGLAGGNSVLLLVCRDIWGRLFTSEEEVIKIVSEVMWIVALFQLTDGVSGAAGGLLRGAGKAPLGALINLTSYYVVGLPLGLYVCFLGPKLGLEGLWIGLAVALTGTALVSTVVIWRMNFEKEAERARVRMGLARQLEEENW